MLKCTFIVSRKFALNVTVIALLTMSFRVSYLHSNRSGRSAGTNAASYYPPPDLNPRPIGQTYAIPNLKFNVARFRLPFSATSSISKP